MQAFFRNGYLMIEDATRDQKSLLENVKEALPAELGIAANQFVISARGFGRNKRYELTAPCPDAPSGVEMMRARVTQITSVPVDN